MPDDDYYNPDDDNPIQGTDRVPFHAVNIARSVLDLEKQPGARSGWSWNTIYQWILRKLGGPPEGPDPGWNDLHRPGFIVREHFPDYVVLGALTGIHYEDGNISFPTPDLAENALWLAAVELDASESSITALRPLPIHASTVDLLSPHIALSGLGLLPNQYGYTLEVMDDGRTVIAIPKPAPPAILITTGQSNHQLTGSPETWFKITADSSPAPAQFDPGDILSYRALVAELGNEGGSVDFALGIDAPPTGVGITVVVPASSQFTSAGIFDLGTTINAGQSIALYARGRGAGAVPVSFLGTWDYKQSNGNPSNGEIRHQSNLTEMRISYFDNDDNNREDEIRAVPVGATIDMTGGITWTVDSYTFQSSHARFQVTPAARSAEAETLFTFTWTPVSNADMYILGGVEDSYVKVEQRA